MPKAPIKAKSKPKNEEMYTITVPFIAECTYEERESILRRTIIKENNKYDGKPFRFIIAEKDMESAKVNVFVRKKKG